MKRADPYFALCGLCCGLCPMYHIREDDHCPGCGRASCKVVKCAAEHGNIEYCGLCPEYPCERYGQDPPYDSFITYRNVSRDFDRIRRQGLASFRAELEEKVEILRFLLREYNDGRCKSFLCAAVNLLDIADVKAVLAQLGDRWDPDTPLKERALLAKRHFQAAADEKGVILKLNRKK